jgi:hypothetical protein
MEAGVVELPEDSESLKAVVRSLLRERDGEKQRADDLQVQNLRLQLELKRYKKRYYGPCADRLRSSGELAQLLLNFAEQLDPTSQSIRTIFQPLQTRKSNCGS